MLKVSLILELFQDEINFINEIILKIESSKTNSNLNKNSSINNNQSNMNKDDYKKREYKVESNSYQNQYIKNNNNAV